MFITSSVKPHRDPKSFKFLCHWTCIWGSLEAGVRVRMFSRITTFSSEKTWNAGSIGSWMSLDDKAAVYMVIDWSRHRTWTPSIFTEAGTLCMKAPSYTSWQAGKNQHKVMSSAYIMMENAPLTKTLRRVLHPKTKSAKRYAVLCRRQEWMVHLVN